MADNYLEHRMEDLRAGRRRAASPAAVMRPVLGMRLLPKRALVVGRNHRQAIAVAQALLTHGLKTAIWTTLRPEGEKLAAAYGARFYFLDPKNSDFIGDSFQNLMQTWRDVDIIVNFVPEAAESLWKLWENHKRKYPIPSDFSPRIVNIGYEFTPSSPLPDDPAVLHAMWEATILGGSDDCPDLTASCLFLCLPFAGTLKGTLINIDN